MGNLLKANCGNLLSTNNSKVPKETQGTITKADIRNDYYEVDFDGYGSTKGMYGSFLDPIGQLRVDNVDVGDRAKDVDDSLRQQMDDNLRGVFC